MWIKIDSQNYIIPERPLDNISPASMSRQNGNDEADAGRKPQQKSALPF